MLRKQNTNMVVNVDGISIMVYIFLHIRALKSPIIVNGKLAHGESIDIKMKKAELAIFASHGALVLSAIKEMDIALNEPYRLVSLAQRDASARLLRRSEPCNKAR